MGHQIKIKQILEMHYLFNVLETSVKGESRIDVLYERIKVDQQNDLMPISYDSDSPGEPDTDKLNASE